MREDKINKFQLKFNYLFQKSLVKKTWEMLVNLIINQVERNHPRNNKS